jgi:hypothetical protein
MKPKWTKRIFIVRSAICILPLLIFYLGKIETTVAEVHSGDGRFLAKVTEVRGWRVDPLQSKYSIYVTDQITGEHTLAAQQSAFCVYNPIWLDKITWRRDNLGFTCQWAILYNGIHPQNFKISVKPLKVHAGQDCCSA